MKCKWMTVAAVTAVVSLGAAGSACADITLDFTSRAVQADARTFTFSDGDVAISQQLGLFNESVSGMLNNNTAAGSQTSTISFSPTLLTASALGTTSVTRETGFVTGRSSWVIGFTLDERSRFDFSDVTLTATEATSDTTNSLRIDQIDAGVGTTIDTPFLLREGFEDTDNVSAFGFLDPGAYLFTFSSGSLTPAFGASASTTSDFDFSLAPAPIPAPGAALLAMIGLPLVGLVRRRKA